MNKVKMTRKEMENLVLCKDCRYFHRYRLRTQVGFREEGIGEDEVEVYEDVDTCYRCLVGVGQLSPPMNLTECIIVECNQFERRIK